MSPEISNTFSPDATFVAGAQTFESTFAKPAQSFIDTVDAMAPGFGHLIVEMEFGNIYNRSGLALKTRELIIIASCATLGETGFGAVRMHVGAALRAGATHAEIVETLVQVSMSAGLPTALGALQVVHEVFSEMAPAPHQP